MTATQCSVLTAAIRGVDAIPVDVEVDVGTGIPSFSIVGLADAAVQEARERVRAAIKASGFDLPGARIVVNLAPGPLRKHGTAFDLPIALALLIATRQLSPRICDSTIVAGELSLDGRVRPVPGLLAYALSARDRDLALLGPPPCAHTASVEGVRYRPIRRLSELRSGAPEDSMEGSPIGTEPGYQPDFAEVAGQETAVRALCVAAAGGHHVLLVGPPGSGKTMLARRMPSILPPLTDSERVETALVHSVSGLDESAVLSGVRPFRAPHHSASTAGLVGGGTPPRAGEASLAHNGVLFLDEMPEFGPAALQCLRQPLEDGIVTVVRVDGRVSYPANFTLVGAANPCRCGFLGDPDRRCTCAPADVDRYAARIGGPLIDRIDLLVDVSRPDPALLMNSSSGTKSAVIRDMVLAAREFASVSRTTPSSGLTGPGLLEACGLDSDAAGFVVRAARAHHLSGRGVTRLLRVARTLADMDEATRVGSVHLSEALSYRRRSTL